MVDQAMKATMRITKALADPQRVRILLLLRHGELCVCQIVAVLGLAPSTISKHLSLLADAGLIDMRKQGRWAYYRLPARDAADATPLVDWLSAALAGDEAIERDAHRLDEVLAIDPEEVARSQRIRGQA
jgi:ArsR family transcriptional regulator, arsenate/arsenite/antimonite-responsive transcriptional repressor